MTDPLRVHVLDFWKGYEIEEFSWTVGPITKTLPNFAVLMADYQVDPAIRKGLGDVVRLGHRWMEGSRCDRFLISLPYPYGRELEWCNVGDDHVRFLWLVPITEAEHQFINEHGVEAFEEKLERSGVDPIDGERHSIV